MDFTLYSDRLMQVCNFAKLTQDEFESVVASMPGNEICGVGRRIAAQLNEGGVQTALDMSKLDTATVRGKWSVLSQGTVRELQGTPCIDLENASVAKKEIACTRSFGQPVPAPSGLNEAVRHFASRAAEKLRKQGSTAHRVMCFVRTCPFRKDPQYVRSIYVPLRRSPAKTGVPVSAAVTRMKAHLPTRI